MPRTRLNFASMLSHMNADSAWFLYAQHAPTLRCRTPQVSGRMPHVTLLHVDVASSRLGQDDPNVRHAWCNRASSWESCPHCRCQVVKGVMFALQVSGRMPQVPGRAPQVSGRMPHCRPPGLFSEDSGQVEACLVLSRICTHAALKGALSGSLDCCPCVYRCMAGVRSLPAWCRKDWHRCKWCLRAFDTPKPSCRSGSLSRSCSGVRPDPSSAQRAPE